MNNNSKLVELKRQKNAILLAHYYVLPEIQDAADFVGDSLALAQEAKKTTADVILFAGVHFMAETAKILNPNKIVLIPDAGSGCSLADLSSADEILKWKNSFKNPYLITYINCSTAVKSISDVICTSSNAEKIVKATPAEKTLLFATDQYLGSYLNNKLNLNMHLWKDYCRVHREFSEEHLLKLKIENPDAVVLAHPECPGNLLKHSDFIGSTTAIINYTVNSNSNKFIIITEVGILHKLKSLSPNKQFLTINNNTGVENYCVEMKKNTIEKLILALENMQPEIIIDEELRKKALAPLELMLNLS